MTRASLSLRRPHVLLWTLLVLALRPGSLLACAACYGQSDSPLALGLNWGIMSLMVVVVGVLGGFAAFFIFLVRRGAAVGQVTQPSTQAPVPRSAEKSNPLVFTS